MRKKPAPRVTVARRLLTASWTAEVNAMEAAIATACLGGSPVENECSVAFFEMASDRHLHVNVTHKYRTQPVAGWAGPGVLSGGFVHNRRFVETDSPGMARRVCDMVLAPRDRNPV